MRHRCLALSHWQLVGHQNIYWYRSGELEIGGRFVSEAVRTKRREETDLDDGTYSFGVDKKREGSLSVYSSHISVAVPDRARLHGPGRWPESEQNTQSPFQDFDPDGTGEQACGTGA